MFTAAEALAPRGSNPGAITLLAAPSPSDCPGAWASPLSLGLRRGQAPPRTSSRGRARNAAPPAASGIPGRRLRGGVRAARTRGHSTLRLRASSGSMKGRHCRPWCKFSCVLLGPAPGHRPHPLLGARAAAYLQPPAADQARIVHGGGDFGPGEGGRREAAAAGGGRREGERSLGDRGGGRRGGPGGAERSGAGPAPSLRLGARAGFWPPLPALGVG